MELELRVVTSPPSSQERWIRSLKVLGLSARRLVLWQILQARWPRPSLAAGSFPCCVYEAAVPIQRRDADAHPLLEEGKRRNLQLAAPAFDGLALEPGRPLSFWRTLGPIRAEDGYQAGMELQGGCIVPSLGGGLCLLSNALFELGARLGWRIVERHGHTVEAMPTLVEPWGLDATVFYPYVDLCLEPNLEGRLRVRVEGDWLRLTVEAARPVLEEVELWAEDDHMEGQHRYNRIMRRVGTRVETIGTNKKRITHSQQRRRNCLTCNEHSCSARQGLLRKAGVAQ